MSVQYLSDGISLLTEHKLKHKWTMLSAIRSIYTSTDKYIL